MSTLSYWDMKPSEVRKGINERIMKIEASTPNVFSVSDKVITHDNRITPIRIYKPNNTSNLPIILFIHGGGWLGGNLDTHDNLARYLCSQSSALVISVGYLNSPEGKFPLPLEQCYDALLWISKHTPGDTNRIAVVGDSAGGTMAAALCLMTRDRLGPKIRLQVLINPGPDLTCKGTLERKNDELDTLRWFALQYLSDAKETNNPYVSPLIAKDLSRLPPAVVILAEKDSLHDDGKAYANRLQDAGTSTQIYTQQGINHLAGHGARASSLARESLDIAVTSLKNSFFKQLS